MEPLTYSDTLQQVFQFHLDHAPELHAIYDQDRDRYLLLNCYWEGEIHQFNCPVYVTLENDKIWIHCDFTEPGIANQLLEAGVPKMAIVLAFHAPNVRQYTDFAPC